MNQGKPIPKPTEWYAQFPFDSSAVAYLDQDGGEVRYMDSPLDERYKVEPAEEFVTAGTLPPEEREVVDTLVVELPKVRVPAFERWWSRHIKPTRKHHASEEALQRLKALCCSSPEYRAAFCRLANARRTIPWIKLQLKNIVAESERHGRL